MNRRIRTAILALMLASTAAHAGDLEQVPLNPDDDVQVQTDRDASDTPAVASNEANPCGGVKGYQSVGSGLCIDSTYYVAYTTPLTQTQIDAIRNGVLDKLRDPGSAIFGKTGALVSSTGKVTICGMINAKNGYGGYTGMEIYQLGLVGDRVDYVALGDIARLGLCPHVRL